ncbi:hypothetical protein DICSQDRAFT_161982 [Dichomitus squalens LYAD-421 SS1]|uniref:F-box domain-containing protein n=1 Tax=Dichomitus squalens (strain LYAD-421) TaxID=732165 RepID=R7SXA2_DICSQ|nr:uncharacterized protein DICSQDRAFT_161982 [Dichomitus squalens LYAD-421 SS1]EJF60583.1 hypothetical protein DICSQDRAFT_161982 [Dichomitus squalens LYAD-421 SS1]
MSYLPSIGDQPTIPLPIEIYEQIIDSVGIGVGARDYVVSVARATLCSCCLTCQAWLPRSRALLYKSITLKAPRPSDLQISFQKLVRTILDSPLIAALVENITLSELSASKSGVASVLPILLIGRLPHLRTFTIHETTLVVSPGFCSSISSFPALETLKLATVMFPNISAFRRLLTALPRLRDLTLDNVFWQTVGAVPETMIQYIGSMPPIRRLSVIGGQVVGPATWAVLELLAPYLEQLIFSDWNQDKLLAPNKEENMLQFPRLVSLTFRAHPRPLARGFSDFLSKAEAQQLRVINLINRMMLKSTSDLPTMSRRLLRNSPLFERVVTQARLPALEAVNMVVEVWDLSGRIVEELEQRMPTIAEECREKLGVLHRRGILRVIGVNLVDDKINASWFWLGPSRSLPSQYSCIWQYGVPLLDAITIVLGSNTL